MKKFYLSADAVAYLVIASYFAAIGTVAYFVS